MTFLKKHFWLLFGLLLALACVGYYGIMSGQYIWSDEAFTFAIIRHPYREVWDITAADVHPPLYYMLMKFLLQPFGYRLGPAKLTSVLPYLGLLAFGGYQLKKLFDEKTALLFMGLFFLFPFTLPYAVEIRMYAMAALFVFGCAVYGYRCVTEERIWNWIWFTVFGILAAYTHYFSLVSVGVIYLLVLIFTIVNKRGWKAWLVSALVTILTYVPWLRSFLSQLAYKANHEYWIQPINLKTLLIDVNTIFGALGVNEIFTGFVLLAFLAALVAVLCSKDKKLIRTCLCALIVPAGTVFLGLVASWILRPIWISRYLVPAAPLLVLFLTLAIVHMEPKPLAASILTVMVIGGVLNYQTFAVNERTWRWDELDSYFVETHADCEAYVLNMTDDDHMSSVLCYYEPETPVFRDAEITAANPYSNQRSMTEFDAMEYDRILMFVDVGDPAPYYLDSYDVCEPLGTIHENGDEADVYLLSRSEGG